MGGRVAAFGSAFRRLGFETVEPSVTVTVSYSDSHETLSYILLSISVYAPSVPLQLTATGWPAGHSWKAPKGPHI